MSALYNEIEPYPAQWLRNLIAGGHIAPGVVDERSIVDLSPDDVRGPGQRHFFAGVGIWSYALRLAGWPDELDVWTGSCPCQPFSSAGKRSGFDDERHLWPVWFDLIRECRPDVIFGEQVASPDGLAWLDAVFADLESAGYACAAFDLCSAGFGAPHIRQRLYFVAVADTDQVEWRSWRARISREWTSGEPAGLRDDRRVADDESGGRPEGCLPSDAAGQHRAGSADGCGLGDADSARRSGIGHVGESPARPRCDAGVELPGSGSEPGPVNGFWRDAEWIPCRDPERGIIYRPVEPGTFPLAHGATARVGRLRAYGNGLCAPQAAVFVRAVMEVL